ncbi:magnesium transporter [Chloroherpeton thalassium ATCC 35110]|uniref:Magnesium transporter MgtE n=1 Tax=Chloroherpeton thalassium (strain ATCC 35110 / GB-78) TaxID=517418 RepID=B3QUY9_CHLT3|nr:magnesium transporter [Chloroherpeton thalassium]ACF14490.1 magnesium transporter [Chloroherpeton thalassium ATCC 35110]
MIGKTIQPEIRELIERRDFNSLRQVFNDWLPVDLAELISDLPENEQAIVFRLLSRELADETFEYLEFDVQKNLLEALAKEDVRHILNSMSPDDRTALLEELPAAVVKELLSLLSAEQLKVAQTLLGYPEGSVGRLMTTDYLSVKESWTTTQVMEHIRKYGKDSETINVIYVVNDLGKLIDEIRIRELLLAPLDEPVHKIMDRKFIALKAADEQMVAVETFKREDRVALPVVDSAGMLLGIVTVDDVFDVAEEEETEDIQKFGGVEALEDPYMDSSLFEVIKKRAVWLVVLFVGEMLTATAMSFFEEELAKAVVLATFIPLIISSGGNSGSQAATLIIRALALGEISLTDWWNVMRREILSGLALGTVLGFIGFIRILIWSLIFGMYGSHWLLIGGVVGVSLLGVVLLGTLSGSMLPLLLQRFGADPATSSAPFVATIVDVAGIIIYFTVAATVLKGILL